MDLIEVGDIKKRWQEYTERRSNKGLFDLDKDNGMVHSCRARHLGVCSQVGFKKHHYEQS